MGYYSVRCCYDIWFLNLLWQRFKTHNKFFEFASVYEEGTRRPDLCHLNKRSLYVCAGKGGHGVMADIKLITTLTKIILSCWLAIHFLVAWTT